MTPTMQEALDELMEAAGELINSSVTSNTKRLRHALLKCRAAYLQEKQQPTAPAELPEGLEKLKGVLVECSQCRERLTLGELVRRGEDDCDEGYRLVDAAKEIVMAENKAELLAEDLECVHAWLDEQGTPRHDEGHDGATYSIVGRIQQLLRARLQEQGEPVAELVHCYDDKGHDSLRAEIIDFRGLKEGDKLYSAPPSPAIPGDQVVVPREPTATMVDRAFTVDLYANPAKAKDPRQWFAEVYRAMLTAHEADGESK